jgi:DUF971 family protein
MSDPWPLNIRLGQDGRCLAIQFDNGEAFELAAEFLRVESPSAEVKGHGPGQEVLVTGKSQIRITKVDPIGNYAIRLHFDDGHSTGIYTWSYLLRLGRENEQLWKDYLNRLARAGSRRDG